MRGCRAYLGPQISLERLKPAIEGGDDGFANSIDLTRDFGIPKSKNREALFDEIPVPPRIDVADGMATAVDLNDESGFPTDEIGHVGADRDLSKEFVTAEAPIP